MMQSQQIPMTFQRYETKYMLSPIMARKLRKSLPGHLQMDEYGLDTICSLYYDTPDHQLIRRSLEKPVYKEKLRLRSYGPAKETSPIYVELKKKYEGIVYSFSALLALPVFAWLYMHRSMETITKVNMPNALLIGAGDAKPIQQLELSNIDVSGAQKYKDVVFCVYSTKPGLAYHLQLAHTTNIGFSYEIDKASIETDAVNGSIFYLGDYYKKGSKLAGNYLNKETESNYATNAYHEKTYEKYGNVQISAEPLYWKTASQEKLPDERQKPDKNGNYVNYYILHITWDETVQNNKETDMIYIMAG